MVNDNVYDEVANIIRGSLKQLDEFTKGHCKRMLELSEEMVPFFKMSKKDTKTLGLAAALHDIGKKYIPVEILNKNGELTSDDWDIIKTHPHLGWELMKKYPDLTPVADAILYHHERWDGTGYPTKCSKENIPLLSRIITIFDSFDAMTNDRPYRKAMPVQYALSEIVKNAGTQFDPFVSRVFVKMYSERYIN